MLTRLYIAAFALWPIFGAAQPLVEERQAGDCVVNSREIDRWDHNVSTRVRVEFSSENTPTEAYCEYFGGQGRDDGLCGGKNDWSIRNVQCYFNEELQKWVVDMNIDSTPTGNTVLNTCLQRTRDKWRIDNHCRTG